MINKILKNEENPLLKTHQFYIDRNLKNTAHGKVLSICIVIFEIIFLMIALMSKANGVQPAFDYTFYMGMYTILIAISLTFYVLLKRYEEEKTALAYHKKYYYITVGFGYIFILWGILVSFADQGLYSNLNALFINLIAVASFLYIAPKDALIMFFSQGAIFYVFISNFQKDTDILTGHYVNSAVIFFFMWIASYLSHSVFASDFLNKHKLEKQLHINHEINEQLQEVVEQLEALVIEDSLTGLPNRRGLERFLKNVENLYTNEVTNMSFIMIDIDYFKQYNDHYSHLMGDEALKQISTHIKSYVRSLNDYAIRFGGEEFLFISVSQSEEKMIELADKMRKGIEGLKIPHANSKCSNYTTISLGLVNTTIGNMDWMKKQISNADKALYKAKDLGRNRLYVMRQDEII
ncbi:MAG: diguanylate cyclase [Clostridia bacterium]|nr:diguanylate cyclase [Clostridia bacterium]